MFMAFVEEADTTITTESIREINKQQKQALCHWNCPQYTYILFHGKTDATGIIDINIITRSVSNDK